MLVAAFLPERQPQKVCSGLIPSQGAACKSMYTTPPGATSKDTECPVAANSTLASNEP
jgi:hypothetical protein